MIAALSLLFFLTAVAYSTVGFGGGSTYLALMVLFALPIEEVRPLALLCNIAVVSYGTWCFSRAGHLKLQKVLPFVVSSIPMAFLGGTFSVNTRLYTWLLTASLTVAAMRMLWIGKPVEGKPDLKFSTLWTVGLAAGAVLGLLAGIVGIGGGIYLAPVLLLLGWSNAKETAAAASFFILVNSLAGLAGQITSGWTPDFTVAVPLLASVAAGGVLGSRLGSGTKTSRLFTQRLTAVLMLAVCGRLFWATL